MTDTICRQSIAVFDSMRPLIAVAAGIFGRSERPLATQLRFSANINTFNACADRYVLTGYGQRYSMTRKNDPAGLGSKD